MCTSRVIHRLDFTVNCNTESENCWYDGWCTSLEVPVTQCRRRPVSSTSRSLKVFSFHLAGPKETVRWWRERSRGTESVGRGFLGSRVATLVKGLDWEGLRSDISSFCVTWGGDVSVNVRRQDVIVTVGFTIRNRKGLSQGASRDHHRLWCHSPMYCGMENPGRVNSSSSTTHVTYGGW